MPRGGARTGPNIGRPKGSVNKRNAAIAQIAAKEGVTPIEAMLIGMRYHYEKAQQANDTLAVDPETGEVIAAPRAYHYEAMLEFARQAAPYIHPRLATVEVSGPAGGAIEHTMTHTDREKRALDMLTVVRKRAKATN